MEKIEIAQDDEAYTNSHQIESISGIAEINKLPCLLGVLRQRHQPITSLAIEQHRIVAESEEESCYRNEESTVVPLSKTMVFDHHPELDDDQQVGKYSPDEVA